MIQEVREWFFRTTSVLTGSKQDREPTFIKQWTSGANKDRYKLFLKDNVPSENVFKKLFQGLTFKLNPEDTAFETQQGLVQKATDVKALNRDSTDNGVFESDGSISGISGLSDENTIGSGIDITKTSANFTTVVIPSQIPNIHNTDNVDGTDEDLGSVTALGLTITKLKTVLTGLGGKFRKNFKIEVARKNQIIIDADGKLKTDGLTTTQQIVESVSIDGGGLVTGVITKTLTFVDGVLTNIV